MHQHDHLNGVMFDLETLGRAPGCVILSIGLCRFDVSRKVITDEYYANIDVQSSKAIGCTVEKETVEWWKKHPEMLKMTMKDAKDVTEVMNEVRDFLLQGHGNYKLWSWGTTFDVPILQAVMTKALGLTPEQMPWKYINVMDARTVQSLFGVKIERPKDAHHNALFDSRMQAQYLIDLFNGE